jgi:hypothetical protein
MSPYRADRRNGERRRRPGYGSYTGPERRSGRDRRRTGGRRGYDRRRSDANGDEYEGYYYGPQKKQQNPLMFVGIAGGVILLIIIIAVAAGGSSEGSAPRTGSYDDGSSEDMEQRARELVQRAGEAWQAANKALAESGQQAADPLYGQAYGYFEQAHRIYVDLDKRHPNSQYYVNLQDLEKNMGEVNRRRGWTDNR